MKVRLHASWCTDVELREAFNKSCPAGDYRWRDMELTLDDGYDWFVVFNHPTHDDFDRSRTVVFQSEPRIHRQRIAYQYADRLEGCRVVDTERHFNLDKWYIDRSFRQLLEPVQKSRGLSLVVSGLDWLPRHRQRLAFALDTVPRLGEVDHFGRGLPPSAHVRGPLEDKAAGLLPYRYTFNAENSLELNYFTEKILDPILCECLCFYDGCPNLEAFLDPDVFVRVSIDRPDEALEIMRAAMAEGEWERRLPAIREQKRLLMHDLNPLEIIRKVLRGESIRWRADDEFDASPPAQPHTGLPPVFVIGMDGASERRARVSRHLRRLGIPYSMERAVDGASLPPAELARRVDQPAAARRLGRPLTPGEAGCALSHVEAMQRLLASGAPAAVVLEDDARLTDQAAELIAGVARAARPGDLVLLGALGGAPLRVGPRVAVGAGSVVVPVARGGVWGSHAYLVTREAAAVLLDRFRRVVSLADDWSLVGSVVNLRMVDPYCAWAPGPYMSPSAIESQRAEAESWRATPMRHSLLARAGYKARLIDAVHPRIGGRMVKLTDMLEAVAMRAREARLRRFAGAAGKSARGPRRAR